MNEKYIVIMIEKEIEGENLSVQDQINEVVGPFENEKEATEWAVSFRHRMLRYSEQSTGRSAKIEYFILPLKESF